MKLIACALAALSLSAAGLVGIALHEGYSDKAIIPVPGDKPTIGFGSTTRADGSRAPGVRELAAQATRDAILRAATKVFARHGFAGGRIEQISKAAKSYDRMIYYYFGGKEGLYLAVLENAYRGIREAEQKLRVDHADPVEAIRRLAELTFDHHSFHGVFHRGLSLHFHHALGPAGHTKRAGERHRAEQKVFLFFTGLQRHHEALNALTLAVERLHVAGEYRPQTVIHRFGRHRREHRPRQHIGTVWQRRNGAIGAVYTGSCAGCHTSRHRRTQLRKTCQGHQHDQNSDQGGLEKMGLHGKPFARISVRASCRRTCQ